MITVHGRTRTQGFSGASDPAIIRKVREAVPARVPVVGNGDVLTVEDFRRMRDETGCDAVMIGRGAMGNPWLFERLREVACGRPDPGPPGIEGRRRVFTRHIALMRELKRGPPSSSAGVDDDRRASGGTPVEHKLIHEVRKAAAWYVKGLYGANQVRQVVWKLTSPDQVIHTVLGHLDQLAHHQLPRSAA
jgi:tRNA-dihydrouridine synthase